MMDDADRAFESWYRVEHPRLVVAVVLVTGDPEVARDSVDEACARALQRWERVSSFEFPTAWTYRVALNVARRAYRRRDLEARILRSQSTPPDIPPPSGEVWHEVSKLTTRQRQVVVLRHVADLPEMEIASILGISRGNVARTLHDAHRRLGEIAGKPIPPLQQEIPNVAT